MCSISGFLSLNNSLVKEDSLDNMLRLLRHRGPDSHGKKYFQIAGFAHNRLSLLDLSDFGNQPFEDDNYVLVYNGEVYNYLEIRKELAAFESKSSSDTAVLFQALREWGVENTVKRIKGMFAFAWYNKQSKELFLVRDRLGIKPLFYGIDNQNTFWFASEVKAILGVMPTQANAFKVLFSSLGALERSRVDTAWDAIKHVEPGTYLHIKEDVINVKKYYSVYDTVNEKEYNRLNKLSVHGVAEEFSSIFSSSIKSMCMGDAPMGSYVSGGIDSSIVTNEAIKFLPDIKLFTANVLGKYSEFEDTKRIANILKKDLYDYPYEKQFALRDWARVTWHYESPMVVHFNAIPFASVSKLANDNQIKAVLTGEGSDELFLGYSSLVIKRYKPLIQIPYTILDSIYNKMPKIKGFITDTGGSQDLLGLFRKGAQNFSVEMFLREGKQVYDFIGQKDQEEHLETSKMLYEHLLSLLWRNDRMGMMYSIESRFPFLDEDIVTFGMNLPIKFKIGKSSKFHNYKHPFLIDKYIVRKYAEGKLPNDLVYKKKNGFPVVGLRSIHVDPKFFDNGVIKNILQLSTGEFSEMCKSSSNYLISLLASVEIWAKLFIEKKSIEEVDYLILKHITIK